MKLLKFATILALNAGFAGGAFAANLSGPFDLESTAVLPKGVNSPRFRGVWLSMTDKFNGSGVAEPLGLKLNKVVTWNDIISAQPDQTQKNLVQGSVMAMGYGLDGSPGSTSGIINTDVQVTVPTYTRGLTDNLTLIVAVPVYKINVSADTGFIKTAQGQAWLNERCDDPVKCSDAQAKLNNAINDKALKNGYAAIGSSTTTEVGDIKVGGKYRFVQNDVNALASKVLVSLPTGSRPDASKIVDTATGDGQVSVAGTLIWDVFAAKRIRLNTYAGYVWQPEDTLERRIPTAPTETLSSDKEVVKRDRGDQLNAGAGVYFGNSNRGFSGGLGYTFQNMNGTTFNGSKFNGQRYTWLEAQYPGQKMHSATVAGQFSTIEYFKEKTFFYPFTSQLSYTRILAGENVPTSDVVSAELVMFF